MPAGKGCRALVSVVFSMMRSAIRARVEYIKALPDDVFDELTH
jgi:hypothetical protein